MMAGKVPTLTELAKLSVSAQLEAAGIEVLTAHSLKKALRRTVPPTLIYVFSEGDRESVAAVERAAKQFPELKIVAIRYSDLTKSELMSSHFSDRLSAPALYLFHRGREMYRGEIWDRKKSNAVLDAIQSALD